MDVSYDAGCVGRLLFGMPCIGRRVSFSGYLVVMYIGGGILDQIIHVIYLGTLGLKSALDLASLQLPSPSHILNLLSRYLPGNTIHSEIEMCPHHRFGTPAPHRSIMSLLPTARIEHLCLLASADNVSAFKYLVENTCFELSGTPEDEFLQEFFVERTGGNILHVAARRGAVGMSLNSYLLSVSL